MCTPLEVPGGQPTEGEGCGRKSLSRLLSWLRSISKEFGMQSKLIHSQSFKLFRIFWSAGEDKRLLPTYRAGSFAEARAFSFRLVSSTVSFAAPVGILTLGASCENSVNLSGLLSVSSTNLTLLSFDLSWFLELFDWAFGKVGSSACYLDLSISSRWPASTATPAGARIVPCTY